MVEKTIKTLEDFWQFIELVRSQKASNNKKITISSIEAGAGISSGMISRYKKKGFFPSLYNILAICNYLGIDVRMIFEGNIVSSECEEAESMLALETDGSQQNAESRILSEGGNQEDLEDLSQKLNMDKICNEEFLKTINELMMRFLNSKMEDKETIINLLTSITQLMN